MALSLHYYDLVLLAIAVSLALGAFVGVATPIAIEAAVASLGVLAVAFIVHALFVNGPVDEFDDLTEEVELEKVPAVLSPLESGSS